METLTIISLILGTFIICVFADRDRVKRLKEADEKKLADIKRNTTVTKSINL